MGNIDVGRWLLGGVVAGAVMWVFEGIASVAYMDQMQASMAAHNLSMDLSAGAFALSVIASLLAGLVIVFFYAASRPRFGPGPRTAVIVAVALFFGSYLLTVIGYLMLGLFPVGMLLTWSVIGFVEMILASLAGGWVYRES